MGRGLEKRSTYNSRRRLGYGVKKKRRKNRKNGITNVPEPAIESQGWRGSGRRGGLSRLAGV